MGLTKEIFFRDINRDMITDEAFYMKVYGYSAYDPQFETTVISLLDDLGLSKAITGYREWKRDYEEKQLAKDKTLAIWYAERVKKDYDERQRKPNRSRGEQKHMFRGFS